MECEGCTLCCDIYPVPWLGKKAFEPCIHCDGGCKIHDTKPEQCRNFECLYYQADDVDIGVRPDKCGIVFEKLSDRILYGAVDHRREISEMARGQINSFLFQGLSVVLASVKKREPKFFIQEQHDEKEVRQEFTKCLEARYGNLRD